MDSSKRKNIKIEHDDFSLAEMIIEHLSSEDPGLGWRDRDELIKYATDSLEHLDRLIKFGRDSPSHVSKTKVEDAVTMNPDVKTYISRRILDRHLSKVDREETIIICLDSHKFFDHWKLIKDEFISKWKPEFSYQLKICFCLEVENIGDDCKVIRSSESKVLPWGQYCFSKFNVDIFVKALWLTVIQLA